jgi:Transposase domain (DUF772)
MTGVESKKVPQRSGDTQLYGSLDAWTEKKPLARVVLEAVRRVDGKVLNPVAAPQAGIAFRTRMLLAVVTYCYAAGIYGSEDIEALMREDGTFRFLCENEFPGWRVIQRFRRHNRAAIQRCLEEVLRSASQIKQETETDPHSRPHALAAGDRHDGWVQEQFASEAEARIERAMWMDSVALEEGTPW